MSGGYWDYKNKELENIIFNQRYKKENVFEDLEITQIVYDVFKLLEDFDFYASSDRNEESWLRAKTEFKNKWLNISPDMRQKRIVDESIADLKEELYKSLGIESENK